MADDNLSNKVWRAWQYTKSVTHSIVSPPFRVLFRHASFTEPDGTSVLDLPTEQTRLHHLTEAELFNKANQFDDLAQKLKGKVIISGNTECLSGVDMYLAKREALFTNKEHGQALSELNPETIHLKETFSVSREDINNRIINNENVQPYGLGNKLLEVYANGKKDEKEKNAPEVLEAQFQTDLEAINAQTFTDPSDKTTLIDALTKNHNDALKEFKETMNAQIKIQFHNARSDQSRLAFFKLLQEKSSAENKALLQELAEKRQLAATTSVTLTPTSTPEEKPDIKALELNTLKQIKSFKTLTGLTAQRTENGGYQIHIPWRGNILYHTGLQDNVLADLKMLALAVRATGAEKIVINIRGENEEERTYLARRAYEAALMEGFTGGTGAKEKTKDEDGKDYKESKKEKEAREGNIQVCLNGVTLPLFDSVDKKGKTTKGVFASQHELETFTRYHGDDYKRERKKLEGGHKLEPNPASTAAKTTNSKDQLVTLKQAAPLAQVSGADNTPVASLSPKK